MECKVWSVKFIGCWSDPVGCDPSHLKGLCAQKPKSCIVKPVDCSLHLNARNTVNTDKIRV